MIEIGNKQLEKYLMFKLNKEENKFLKEDLEKINELILNPINICDEYEKINLDLIKYFVNLKKIFFINLEIPEKILNQLLNLKSLESISFEKCNFENINTLTKIKIKDIEFINCLHTDYRFLYKMINLKSLSVVNGILNISGINNLKNLEYLELSYSTILNTTVINLPNLKELHIDNTNIYDVSIISNLPKLEKLSISENQFTQNKEYYINLMKHNICVLNEDLVKFESEKYTNE